MKHFSLALVLALLFAATPPLFAVDPLRTQANVYFNLGYKKFQEQKPDAALKSLDKALAAVPDHQQANFLKGVILIQKRRFDEATGPLEIVTKAQAGNADAWNNLGVAYYSTDRWADAERAFRKTAKLSPNRADVYQNLGIISINKDSPEGLQEAIDAFSQAVELQPKKAEAWRGLGQAYYRQGKVSETAKAFMQSLNLQEDVLAPDALELRLHLADIYFNLDDFEKLKEVLAPLKEAENAESRFFFGCVAYREGEFEQSKEWFSKALEVRPDYPEARFNLAITLYDQGNYEDALKQFEEVLRFNPNDKQARENLDITKKVAVQSFLKQGSESFIREEYYEALQKWERALKLDSENRVALDLVETAKIQAKAQVGELVEDGNTALAEGKLPLALKKWSRAIEIEPGNPGAKKGLAQVREKAAALMKVIESQFKEAVQSQNFPRAETLAQQAREIDKDAAQRLSSAVAAERLKKAEELAIRARKATQEGELAEAVRVYELVTKLAPEESKLRVQANKAKVEIRREINKALDNARKADEAQDFQKAYKGFKRALDLQPENSEAMEGARKAARKARIKSVDPKKINDLYYQGVYAFAAGDNAKAVGLWQEVLSLEKGHKLAKAAVQRAEAKMKALDAVE